MAQACYTVAQTWLHGLTRHSIIFPQKSICWKITNQSIRLIFGGSSGSDQRSVSVKHRASSGCDVSEGHALPELHNRLLLQHQQDVKLGCGLFPVVFPTEIPETEGAHPRSLQVLREGSRTVRLAFQVKHI